MSALDAKAVFYVEDGERSLAFYTQSLGCSLDWNYAPEGRAFVFQVNMLGFQLILNEAEDWTRKRVGCGRVFIGIEDEQAPTFRQHVVDHDIPIEVVPWGDPTLLIRDPDGNWLTFWLPPEDRKTLKLGQTWP